MERQWDLTARCSKGCWGHWWDWERLGLLGKLRLLGGLVLLWGISVTCMGTDVTGNRVVLSRCYRQTGVANGYYWGTWCYVGDAERDDGTVQGPACAMCILLGEDLWIWEPRRGHSLSGCYTQLCPVLQAQAGTPPTSPHLPADPPGAAHLPPPWMKCAETGGAARGKTPWRALTKGVLFKFV